MYHMFYLCFSVIVIWTQNILSFFFLVNKIYLLIMSILFLEKLHNTTRVVCIYVKWILNDIHTYFLFVSLFFYEHSPLVMLFYPALYCSVICVYSFWHRPPQPLRYANDAKALRRVPLMVFPSHDVHQYHRFHPRTEIKRWKEFC